MTVSKRPALEIPTLLLIVATYAGWLAATRLYLRWPLWVLAPLITVIITLHSSVQHEIVHGHPTRWRRLNRLQQTLAGRVLIGSFWRIGMFLRDELLALRHREQRPLVRNAQNIPKVWLEHLLWCVPVIAWLKLVCGMPLWLYFVAMVVPANGLLLIRSFAEHCARPGVRERVAIVENSWLLGPLYLFNNLHALHHEAPGIPWYRYNAHYRQVRERLIAENGGLVYSTYFEVARRYLFRPHDAPVHPTNRVPAGLAERRDAA